MSPTSPYRHAWIAVPLLAAGFILLAGHGRARRVEQVTAAVPAGTVVSAASPTGYAGGVRQLVLPEPAAGSSHWIMQAQHMVAHGDWRVARIDYENAPFGRAATSASVYPWWLRLVARLNSTFTGNSPGLAVERAALVADPLLHLLLLVVTTIFVARRFGAWAAALTSAGLVFLFPFAAAFLPGLPDDEGLSLALGFWSVAPLLAGLAGPLAAMPGDSRPDRALARWFIAAGMAGGLGLWVSVSRETPVLAGIGLGALLATWLAGRHRTDAASAALRQAPWHLWALAGVASSSLGYLLEYYPDQLGTWQLRSVHPLYSLAWLGLGVGLLALQPPAQPASRRWTRFIMGAFALVALAALPVAMMRTDSGGFLTADLDAFRLARLPGQPEATSLGAWLARDGFTATAWATLLPLLLLLPAGWLLLRPATSLRSRLCLAVAAGPVLGTLGFACLQLRGWSSCDAALLALVPAVTLALRPTRSLLPAWAALVLLGLLPGLWQLRPPAAREALDAPEVAGLIERDLAHWLARRALPGTASIIVAPPGETTALSYYGGVAGVGTLSRDNREGLGAVTRLLTATSAEEARTLVERRGITHLVIPSWDSYLAEYVALSGARMEDTFLGQLQAWHLPRWLKPVPYQLPAVPGYEGQSVMVLEVVEEQSEAVALGRLAVYFADTGQLDAAAAVGRALQKFPADLNAWAARAEVDVARHDEAAVAADLQVIGPKLAGGADRLLWERRVGLAVVLVRANQADLAREQGRKCFADATEARLRALPPGTLYRMLVLGRVLGLDFADPALRARAVEMLPADLRARLAAPAN